MQHPLGGLRHPRDIEIRLELRFATELDGTFANVDGHIARPLEVRRNLEGRSDQPQIAGGGLAQSQQAEAQLVDLDVEPIDLPIPRDHRLSGLRVAVDQSAHRRRGLLLDQSTHLENPMVERPQLFFVVSVGVRPPIHSASGILHK